MKKYIFKKLFKPKKLYNHSLKMRLTVVFLIISLFKIQANTYSQNKKITLDLKDATVEELFYEIETLSEYSFLYNKNKIDDTQSISVSVRDKPISNVLHSIFSGTDTYFKVRKKQIILKKGKPEEQVLPINNNREQQTITVTGTVKEKDTDAPIPGANIMEKGTSNGVTTDFDGNYSIDAAEDATLEVSFIGFAKQQIGVDGRSEIDVVMEMETAALDEVVVTALGMKREEKALGYAVQKIKGDVITKTKGVDVGTSLTGKVAGLNVKNSTETF